MSQVSSNRACTRTARAVITENGVFLLSNSSKFAIFGPDDRVKPNTNNWGVVVANSQSVRTLVTIANDAGLTTDIQGRTHTLAQAANLHLMLANERTRYFEAPTLKEAYEYGMKNGDILDRGRAVAPEGPGPGIEVDWVRLASVGFYMHAGLDFQVLATKTVQLLEVTFKGHKESATVRVNFHIHASFRYALLVFKP